MSILNSVQYQCRTFESIYLFQVKNEGDLTLKILDLSQKCLFKRAFSSQDLGLLRVDQILAKGNFTTVLEKLVEKQLLPEEHRLPVPKEVTQKACEKVLQQAIDQFKPKVFVERREIEGFSCPLTLEIFREPVMDEHGHTFEKSAIEEHLKRKNECPINRQPINSLAPNRLVQQTIEEWQKRDPIPNFSLFQKENSKLAGINLQMAQTYAKEGEYGEALESYAKAFQYTRNWTDFIAIPSLFEKMGEQEKATLAYLYLAQYQLQDGKQPEAIQTLETCQRGKGAHLQNNLVLVELYYLTHQGKKALELALQTAEVLSKQNPELAAQVYRRVLRDHPAQFPIYPCLAALLDSPQEKSQVLLKGALQALQEGDYTAAERLSQEAETFSEDSFVDQLISLDLLKKQGQVPRVKQKLLHLARAFEKKELIEQMLQAYKMLFQIERTPEHCQKILTAYVRLQKPQKEFEWSLTYLSLLIEKKEWQQAEKVAQDTLQKSQESRQRTFLYEKLEEVYTHWHGHELEHLWGKLGTAYRESRQLDAAEKTYQKAFERFHGFQQAIAFAEVLSERGKTRESVHTYYEAAVEALLEQNSDRLSLCTREIKQIDPHLQHLDLNQRMHLLTQEHILKLQSQNEKLSNKLSLAQQKIASLEQVVQPLREKAIQEEKRRIAEEQEKIRQAELERKMREELSQIWFGKAKWERFFGDVGVEPPLPKDIIKVLKSPCPYWGGKRIEETHMLVLIPQTVNGRPLTLNMLQELIQSPQGGGHATKYQSYYDVAQKELGDQSVPKSYWALITKDVLPNSRNKTYAEQQALIKGPYAVPGALETATGILMHHAQTAERLYSDNPKTYTRCQETLSKGYRVVVGSFGSSGLLVYFGNGLRRDHYGLGGVRKF